jgi:hypothetical protein
LATSECNAGKKHTQQPQQQPQQQQLKIDLAVADRSE